MKTDSLKSEITNAALRLFPPIVRKSLLNDGEFRSRFGIETEATISLNEPDTTFRRSELFKSIRALYGDRRATGLSSDDGVEWTLTLEYQNNRQLIVMSRDSKRIELPEFWPLSPDAGERVKAFERYADTCNFRDDQYVAWSEIVAARPITDEEFYELQSALKMTPQMMSSIISNEIRAGTSNVASLVPDDTHYYSRLIGDGSKATSLADYVETVAKWHISQLMKWRHLDGLRFSVLLSAHSYFPKSIDPDHVAPESMSRLLEWLERNGDRYSQLGAVEFGLEHLDRYPEIEPGLVKLIEQFRLDDPDDENGRLKLISSLIALVEGELARTQIFRQRPPFWRRLASIAQASLIECQLAQVPLDVAEFSDYAIGRAGRLFYMQTLVDLRREPRWLPDAIVPKQLKAEFLGRIFAAARVNEHKIRSSELRDLVLGEGADGIQKLLVFPYYCFPGPLEGAVDSQMEIPPGFKDEVETDLAAEALKVNSFAGLVNSALVFRIGPELVTLTSTALQRVKYQLRHDGPQDQSFALLVGLATVAGVTRSVELAGQVRILTRVLKRRSDINISAMDALRICMVAAACHQDLEPWCKFVGEWLTEVAFEPLERSAAEKLGFDIEMLCKIQPSLWRTCGKAHAACKAFNATMSLVRRLRRT
jgi:hypothetical protein